MSENTKTTIRKYSEAWYALKLKAKEQLDSNEWQKARQQEKANKVGTRASK